MGEVWGGLHGGGYGGEVLGGGMGGYGGEVQGGVRGGGTAGTGGYGGGVHAGGTGGVPGDPKIPVSPARLASYGLSYIGKAPKSQSRRPEWPQTASLI